VIIASDVRECVMFCQRSRRMVRLLRKKWSKGPLQSLKCSATLNLSVCCIVEVPLDIS